MKPIRRSIFNRPGMLAALLGLTAFLSARAEIKIALLGEQTTHSFHRENDPEYPRFLGELLDADFTIDATKPHPMGGGHLYGRGTHYAVGNFGHPRGTVIDHALENPKAILRSDELKLAEQFAPHVVVVGPFGDHEPLTKVSMDNFTKDLRTLLDRIGTFSSKPTVLVALPIPRGPKDEDANYRRIRQETEQVALEKKLPLVDLWTPFLGKPEFYQDATHLTLAGRRELARIVGSAVRAHAPSKKAAPSTPAH